MERIVIKKEKCSFCGNELEFEIDIDFLKDEFIKVCEVCGETTFARQYVDNGKIIFCVY